MLVTPWGYTLTTLNEYSDMLTVTDFNTITNNKYANDVRIAPAIKGVSQSIRAHCGWHVYPSAACSFDGQLGISQSIKLNATRRGWELLIQLPTAQLTAITSIKIGGRTMPEFAFEPNGLVRVYKIANANLSSYTPVEVLYTCGLSNDDMSAIKELVAYRVMHAVAVPVGISSETADGVTISYSANWGTKWNALANDNLSLLAPYKVRGLL